jgi:hypothetical protein
LRPAGVAGVEEEIAGQSYDQQHADNFFRLVHFLIPFSEFETSTVHLPFCGTGSYPLLPNG